MTADPDRQDTAPGDTALAVAITRGELAALDEVYRRHAAQIHRLARTVAGHRADDVVEDVFLPPTLAAPRTLRPRPGITANLPAEPRPPGSPG
jgi:hypothetical protein